jgi:hypothetical protein
MEMIQLAIGLTLIVGVTIIKFHLIRQLIGRSGLTENEKKFYPIKRVFRSLNDHKEPNEKLLDKYAKDNEKRTILWELLSKYERIDLFPKEYMTIEKLGESYLTNWLNMNDYYDSVPDEIEFLKSISLQNTYEILLFKFKSYEPHLLAEKDWMIGYIVLDKNWEIEIEPIFIHSDFNQNELGSFDIEKLVKNGIQQNLS